MPIPGFSKYVKRKTPDKPLPCYGTLYKNWVCWLNYGASRQIEDGYEYAEAYVGLDCRRIALKFYTCRQTVDGIKILRSTRSDVVRGFSLRGPLTQCAFDINEHKIPHKMDVRYDHDNEAMVIYVYDFGKEERDDCE